MDWTEKRQCVLCNRGGKLLVCNDDGCPISVHESCMGCKARLDEAGNFHCPYCLYRRLAAETCQLREKAMLAKKTLSKFLDKEIRETIAGTASKTSPHEPTDGLGEIPERKNVNTCRIMVVYVENRLKTDQACSDVGKRVGVENREGKTSIEEAEEENEVVSMAFNKNRKRTIEDGMMENGVKSSREIENDDLDGQIFPEKHKRMRRAPKNSLDFGNSAAKGSSGAASGVGVASCREIVQISNSREPKDSSKQLSVIDRSTKLPLQNGKRRVRWSDDEEDMLKEGVEKFSLVTRKNLPWKKILEFGHHVFDASRTPSDLKDKWRNMAK